MEKLQIKWRKWYNGIAPRLTKLEIPGWAGEPNNHTSGDKPQPWHCTPFIEGTTYGLELCYPFDTECHVKNIDGEIVFEGDFSEENKMCEDVNLPPFLSFSPGHFGMTSALDIKVPSGYILRLETHPRFYTDCTTTVPCALPAHIQTEWWSKIFFVVFKNPVPGQTIIFRKGEPYGQALVLPKKVEYDIQEMSQVEQFQRAHLDAQIDKYRKQIVKNDWFDYKGNNFDDKYKILSSIFAKKGIQGIYDLIDSLDKKNVKHKKIKNTFIKKRKL
jgi:hypothetical protein